MAGSFTVSITSYEFRQPGDDCFRWKLHRERCSGQSFSGGLKPAKLSRKVPQILPTGFQDPAGPFMSIDGGYYGPPTGEVAFAQLNGTGLTAISDPKDPNISTPRRLDVLLPNLTSLTSVSGPGLYPVTVTNNNASPSTAYTNIAIVPDYANTHKPGTPSVLALPAGSAPSAIAEDSVLGVAVVAETGTSSIQFLDMRTATPVLLGNPIPTGSIPASTAPGSLPTGVAVDETLHITAVVNYADRSLWIFQTPIPPAAPSATPLGKIDLSTLIPSTAPSTPPSAPPFPYSVGIDSQTHRAIVAFASTNVGFIVNLDPTQPASVCLPGQPPAHVNVLPDRLGHPEYRFESADRARASRRSRLRHTRRWRESVRGGFAECSHAGPHRYSLRHQNIRYRDRDDFDAAQSEPRQSRHSLDQRPSGREKRHYF